MAVHPDARRRKNPLPHDVPPASSQSLHQSWLFPFAPARFRDKLRYAQAVISVDYDDFSTDDQFTVEKQIDRLLHLLIELHNTARAEIKNVFKSMRLPPKRAQ